MGGSNAPFLIFTNQEKGVGAVGGQFGINWLVAGWPPHSADAVRAVQAQRGRETSVQPNST